MQAMQNMIPFSPWKLNHRKRSKSLRFFIQKCLSNVFIIRKRTSRRVKRKSIWIEQIPRKSPFSFGAVQKNAALHPIRKMKRPISHLLALSPFYDASLFSSHTYIWLWNYYGCWAFFFPPKSISFYGDTCGGGGRTWYQTLYLPKQKGVVAQNSILCSETSFNGYFLAKSKWWL